MVAVCSFFHTVYVDEGMDEAIAVSRVTELQHAASLTNT
jgi:hypothetical protein